VTAPAIDAESPAVDDRKFFGHPRGLGLLFTTEMWERFSYYGMRAILVLFLTQALHWSTRDAATLYYTALVYLTPLIGGYLADRWLGTRRSLVIGGVIIALGHFSLAFSDMRMFYLGLALVIIGTGFFKPNVSTMVGQLYRPGDARRDAGFTLFYMGINLGATLGQFVCGWFGDPVRYGDRGWHIGFAAAGVGMVLGLLVYLWGRDKYLPGIGLSTAASRAKEALGSAAAAAAGAETATIIKGVLGAVSGAVLSMLLGGPSILGIAFGVLIGASLTITVFGSDGVERNRVLAIFIVVFFATAFWACYEQAGSSMNLFAANNTDLYIGSFHIPPAWLQSVNTTCILLFGPVFAALWLFLIKRGREPATAMKMVLGLALLGIGFIFMVLGGSRADTGIKVSPLWLVAAYAFHTFGELCISPVGLSYVTKVAPMRYASLLMGVWFLSNAAANKIAGWLAAYTPTPGQPPEAPMTGFAGFIQHVSATNAGFYSIFLVVAFSSSALMLLCVPLLKRLTATVKA
jgi:proton-dependent oligopeptide transporter, POT family